MSAEEDLDLAEDELAEMERWMLASGQIPCPRPHYSLYWPGSRCYCGAQV